MPLREVVRFSALFALPQGWGGPARYHAPL